MSDQFCKHCGCGADIHDPETGECHDNRICQPCKENHSNEYGSFEAGKRYCGCTDELSHSHKQQRGVQCSGFQLFVTETERGGKRSTGDTVKRVIDNVPGQPPAIPLCHRCKQSIPHKSDCITREQERESLRDDLMEPTGVRRGGGRQAQDY